MSSPSPIDTPVLAFRADEPIRRIVVPLVADTGHDRGVEVAVGWAQRFGLPVVLVTVDEADPSGATVDVQTGIHLAHIRDRLASSGLEVGEEMLAGPDVTAALTAATGPEDLVVMTSAGSAGSPAASHGWQLVQATGRPVLLVGPSVESAGSPDGPVVVGLDGSPLAEQSLPVAAGLAAGLDTRLWLVQAVPSATVAQVEMLRQRGERVSASGYLRDTAAHVADGAWDLLGRHLTAGDLGLPPTEDGGEEATSGPDGGPGWEVVVSDDAPSVLADFARHRDASALVVSTHGRSGLRPAALGSTCMATVARATVPVLVVAPTGGPEEALGA